MASSIEHRHTLSLLDSVAPASVVLVHAHSVRGKDGTHWHEVAQITYGFTDPEAPAPQGDTWLNPLDTKPLRKWASNAISADPALGVVVFRSLVTVSA